MQACSVADSSAQEPRQVFILDLLDILCATTICLYHVCVLSKYVKLQAWADEDIILTTLASKPRWRGIIAF